MNRSIRTFGNMLNTACSVYFDRKLRRNHCCDGIKMAKDAIYYLFNSKKAKNVAHLFYSNPDVHTATSVIIKYFDETDFSLLFTY